MMTNEQKGKTMGKNWREVDEVKVGWANADLGTLTCEVLKRDQTNGEPHGVRLVRWAHGKPAKVAYSHSSNRYIFL
jgi:hypothetical protein